MKCKKCNADFQEEWTYCPNCGTRRNINVLELIIIIAGIILTILLFFGIYNLLKRQNELGEAYLQKTLNTKYKENFNEIRFLQSVKNKDKTIGCDTSEVTIKKEGNTEYYLIHSEKNDIDFFAYYDTSDTGNNIRDTYSLYMKKRYGFIRMYEIMQNNFKNIITGSYILKSNKSTNIISESNLNSLLSNINDEQINDMVRNTYEPYYTEIVFCINQDLNDFIIKNYSVLQKIYNEVSNDENDVNGYIYLNNNEKITFDCKNKHIGVTYKDSTDNNLKYEQLDYYYLKINKE